MDNIIIYIFKIIIKYKRIQTSLDNLLFYYFSFGMMRIKFLYFLIIILLVPSLSFNLQALSRVDFSDPDQTRPDLFITPNLYETKFPALNVKEQMTLSPLFTPDNAIDLYAGWISKANTTIELQNQYITQWDDSVSWALDPSPLVRELVNAAGRGVMVRVQVRDDADSDDVTTYFQGVTNIDVRWMGNSGSADADGYYLSATHNKMILIDDKVSLISSINFGESAFTTNREAGMVIQSVTVTNYYKSIFESDWSDGEVPPITLKTSNLPKNGFEGAYQSTYTSHTNIPKTNFTGVYNVTAFANPDNADRVIFNYLTNATESIYVSMYTISRPDFNNTLIALKQANPSIDIQVLISNRRVGASENVDTYAAALSLVKNQIPVYNSTKDDDKVDNFYHNKYWIIDGKHTFIYSGNWSPKSTTPKEADNIYTSSDPNRDMGIAVHDATDIAAFVKTEVWDKDVSVAVAWPLGDPSIGIKQMSFEESEVVSGNVILKAQLNNLDGAEVSYKFGTTDFTLVSIVDNQFTVSADTLTIPNGITSFHVKAVFNSSTYEDSVAVNVVNYHSSENWRLLITEILPDPTVVSDTEGEYIEISNSFPFDINIGSWKVEDDFNQFVFPGGTIIGAYSSLILARNSVGFNLGFSQTADFEMVMSLNNVGESITLLNHKNDIIDNVAYGSGTASDGSEVVNSPGTGISIQRSPLHIDTNTNADFILASPSPKETVPNVVLLLPSDTITTSSSTSASPSTSSSTTSSSTTVISSNGDNSSETADTDGFTYFILLWGIGLSIGIIRRRKK